MIVKAYYSGGRIDVFDTDRMTDGVPQPGNLLTNYTLDLSDVNGESLWLCSYYYEAAQAYKDEKGPKGLPVARRLDGETVLAQVAGELIDASALSWASEVIEVIAPQIKQSQSFLDSIGLESIEGIGVPHSTWQQISNVYGQQSEGALRF